jgi:hypothetical protein
VKGAPVRELGWVGFAASLSKGPAAGVEKLANSGKGKKKKRKRKKKKEIKSLFEAHCKKKKGNSNFERT